jgi:transglutaminase-like putative cysteine protease
MNDPLPLDENAAPGPELLRPGRFIDSDSPVIQALAAQAAAGAPDEREKAIRLFYLVRDGVRYNPYVNILDPQNYRASHVWERGEGNCVGKASILCAMARALGIPSRIGFADVRNHLATPKLLERLGTDVFAYHGYSELWMEGRWVKATPTFNRALCERMGVKTLEFDGRADSLLHPFDADNRQHMEYLRFRGSYADIPAEKLSEDISRMYPALAAGRYETETVFKK